MTELNSLTRKIIHSVRFLLLNPQIRIFDPDWGHLCLCAAIRRTKQWPARRRSSGRLQAALCSDARANYLPLRISDHVSVELT